MKGIEDKKELKIQNLHKRNRVHNMSGMKGKGGKSQVRSEEKRNRLMFLLDIF